MFFDGVVDCKTYIPNRLLLKAIVVFFTVLEIGVFFLSFWNVLSSISLTDFFVSKNNGKLFLRQQK